MNRRTFLTQAAVALPLAAQTVMMPSTCQALSKSQGTKENSSTGSGLKVGPDLSRYYLTRDRVLHGTGPAYTEEFLLEDIHATLGRRFTNFCGDLSGRWIGALSASSQVFGETFPSLRNMVAKIIALQHSDGYFGGVFHYDHPDDDDLALLWGNGRLLVGLMEYYSLTHEAAVLASATKLGDFLVRIGPHFNSQEMADAFSADHYASSYICWTQQTEGLAGLYAATQDLRYRDLCAAISLRNSRRPGDHVHGYLTGLRGTLNLYKVTGDRAHLDQVIAAWQDVFHSGDLLITGGVPERWSPKRDRTEGCAECDWLRLNLGLYRTTADRVYLETAQNVYFNEFSMNQFATGDFGHAKLDSEGVTETVYVRAWWCCTLHGLRTFADIQEAAFRIEPNQVFFDFPIDSRIHSESFSARAKSELSTNGTVRIDIHAASGDQKLTVFKPSWADDMILSHNGSVVRGSTIDKVASGDTILVKYAMSLRSTDHKGSADQAPSHSFHFGPWLLGVSSTANPDYFNELYAQNAFNLTTLRQTTEATPSTLHVPIAAAEIRYVPAEFPEQPAVVLLKAVSEQTASPIEKWQLVFKTIPRPVA